MSALSDVADGAEEQEAEWEAVWTDEAEWEEAAERQPLSPPGQRRSHERRSSSPSILVSCHYSRSPPGQRRF